MPTPSDRLNVCFAYVSADAELATAIARRMEERNLNAWVYHFVVDVDGGDGERVGRIVPARGFLLLLVSSAMRRAGWIEQHLQDQALQDLLDRGVTVIPVTMDDGATPASIAHLQRFSIQPLSSEIDRLVDQFEVASLLDLESLNPKLFESLVYDLLSDLGFKDARQSGAFRPPVGDFVVEFVSKDPFGAERTDTWVVEAKHSRDDRVSPYGVWQLAGFLGSNRRFSKGLLVTNSRLTSSTRRTLEDVEQKNGSVIRVVDGSELRALLLKHPEIAARYFGPGLGAQANG